MKYLLLIVLFFPLSVFAQWKYKSKYEHGFHVDYLGLSRGLSANYNRILHNGSKGFVSSSLGLAFVAGQQGRMLFQSGIGIPLMVTYNHSLGDLDKRIRKRVTNSCFTKPVKYEFEWFAEAGGGLSPVFYKLLTNEVIYTGYLGGRVQLVIDRPYKNSDLVIFLKGGYFPFYRSTDKANVDRKSNVGKPIFGPDQTGNLGFSLGMGF